MQRSKYLALLFLLGTATASYAVGFTSERVLGRDRARECTRGGEQRAMRTRLGEELELTADQRAALDRILDERHRQMSVILAPVRPRMDSVGDATREQIRGILSAEQREKFDAMQREREQAEATERARAERAAGGAR